MSLIANAREFRRKHRAISRRRSSAAISAPATRHKRICSPPVHHGNGPVSTCGGLDLVEVDAKPVDLGDPLGTPGKPKKAVLVERPQITGVQFAMHRITQHQVLVTLGITQHHVRAVVDQFTLDIRLRYLLGARANAQTPAGDRYAYGVGLLRQRLGRDILRPALTSSGVATRARATSPAAPSAPPGARSATPRAPPPTSPRRARRRCSRPR